MRLQKRAVRAGLGARTRSRRRCRQGVGAGVVLGAAVVGAIDGRLHKLGEAMLRAGRRHGLGLTQAEATARGE